jgi:NTE family protein
VPLIVQINPIYRAEVPTSANAIIDRVNEISFNSSLIHELSGLMIINKLIKANHLDKATSGLRHLHLHMVQDQALMSRLSYASKLNADYDFMLTLRDAGKAATRAWLDAHYDSIGKDSSLDLTRLHVEAA